MKKELCIICGKMFTNVHYMLHAAVSLFAQLNCIVKLIYLIFVCLHIHTFILSK